MESTVGQAENLEEYSLPDRDPVQLNDCGCYVFMLLSSSNRLGSSILDAL